GRAIASELPPVQALFHGTSRELLKLYAQQPVIRKTVPDTLTGAEYTIELSVSDLVVEGAAVDPQGIEPRIVPIQLDDVAQRTVPVIARISVSPDSGFRQFGGIRVEPDSIVIRGPEAVIRNTSSVFTERRELTGLREPVQLTVPLDTARLSGGLRLSETEVEVAVEIGAVSERVLIGVPISVSSPSGGRWISVPPAVLVTVRGERARLNRLTADSVQVIARPTVRDDESTVRLEVVAPDRVTAWATPDSATVRRASRD
ncbi:MAG: YbbR-like domain-containing protein, partial [Gemmatimonadales bacterium]